MSVTVNQLLKECKIEYGLRSVAGNQGLNSLVHWVHILEGGNAASFLRGGELVFTTGVMNNTGRWLLDFIKQIYKANASALVVNIGPYIPEIDREVIDYCNEIGFPLFTLPWKTRMVDVTRDFCTIISQSINNETDVSAAFKNLIFHKGDKNSNLMAMESNGYNNESLSCIACIGFKNQGERITEKVKSFAEQAAKSVRDLYCAFEHNQCIIILMYEYTNADLQSFITVFKRLLRGGEAENRVCIGISEHIFGLDCQTKGLEHAAAAYRMAAKRNAVYMSYDDLDIYKLLIAVSDKSVLRDYYNQVLGRLEDYDREHGSNYMGFLKTYLNNNASPQLVSEKEFIHRNTVVNYLKKIDAITGMNMFDLDTKVRCMIGFAVRDLL